MAWNFNPQDYNPTHEFTLIPQGDHRVRISDAEFKTFKSGKEGYEITLDVSGHSGSLWYYIVLDPSDPKKTNQKIGQFFESFNISDFNMDHFKGWVGKVGAVRVKHEQYNGNDTAKVAFVLSQKSAEKLPAPKFAPMEGVAVAPAAPNFQPLPDDANLPF